MIKKILCVLLTMLFLVGTAGCGTGNRTVKIGVSLGVGGAARWKQDQAFMEERAKALGADIEVRLNTTDKPKTQTQDCKDLIDSGIDVLLLTPRDVRNVSEILDYAAEKKVKVISYARAVMGRKVDLFVGYDSYKIGQSTGSYLSEKVYKGDYIVLKGDPNDFNTPLLYEGAMKYLSPLAAQNDINIILDDYVAGWSPEEAKKMVIEAVSKNNNHVDAILAPNDALAGACVEVLKELNITAPVAITGMDADLNALKRIVNDEQSITVYMDLKSLAYSAVEEAVHMATNQKVNVNTSFDNESGEEVDAYLINGQLVTKENLDKVLIDSGHYTREDIYS